MLTFKITGYDMDYHGAVVETLYKEFESLEQAQKWAIAEAPLGVRYGVEEVDPNTPKRNPSPYRYTIHDQYMKRGKL